MATIFLRLPGTNCLIVVWIVVCIGCVIRTLDLKRYGSTVFQLESFRSIPSKLVMNEGMDLAMLT